MFVYDLDNLSPQTRVATKLVVSIFDTKDGSTDERYKKRHKRLVRLTFKQANDGRGDSKIPGQPYIL